MFITLETARLRIRDHVPEDLPTHHALLSDPAAMRFLEDIRTHSMEESQANLEHAIRQIGAQPRTDYFLRMELRDTGGHVGEIGYDVTGELPEGRVAHIGYFIRPCFWGKGYTSEALRELLRFAFEEERIARADTGCLKENPASERVMQKCGLKYRADTSEWHEGRKKPRVEYSLLREEWEAAQFIRSKFPER